MKRPPRYRCAICGATLTRWIYSKHRNVRYCHPDDWTLCEERSLQKKGER